MTDSPTPRRHRGSRRAPRRSRGLVGPVVSALSVLVAIGPVVWLMSRDTTRVDDAAKVLNVAEDTRVDGGSAVEGTTAVTQLITVTKTSPNGRTTTAVVGTPALGAAAGYRGSSWGENIAAGYDSAQKVVAAWMQSDGHRKNILNCRFTTIGIGYDPGRVRSDWGPGSWVQDFGRS